MVKHSFTDKKSLNIKNVLVYVENARIIRIM